MMKKLFTVFLLGCFLAATMPMHALAAKQPSHVVLLEKLIIMMQRDLQISVHADELSDMAARTQILLNELLIAFKNQDDKQLQAIVEDYVADMSVLQDDTSINLSCALSLSLSLFNGLSSLLSAFSTPCPGLNVSNSIAGIIVAFQSYQICTIVNSSTPDQALCQQIVQRQTITQWYGFITQAIDVLICQKPASTDDYIGLLFAVLGLFPDPNACTPTATTTTTTTAAK